MARSCHFVCMLAFPKRRKFPTQTTTHKIMIGLSKGKLTLTFLKSKSDYSSSEVSIKKDDFEHAVKRLQKKNYIALTKTPDRWIVRLLKKGIKRRSKAQLDDLKLEQRANWDKKWRLFIFDIPEKYRYERDFVRKKLKTLGLYNIQRSVFAYHFDCRKELNLVAELLNIEPYTTYAEVSYFDIDKELRRYFKDKI